MMKLRIQALALIASFGLASCGGGTSSGSHNSITPPTVQGHAKAQFLVHWPGRRTSTAIHGHGGPKTISPSAQSLSVSVNGGPLQITNRPSGGFPTTTVVTIDAPVGTDAVDIKAWDLPGAQGNVLDAVVTSQLIVANATNTINATLDGICAAMLIAPVSGQPFAETNSSTVTLPNGSTTSILNSLRIVGTSPESFTITPIDADGNTYVSSAGAPVINLSESGPIHHVAIAANTTGGVTTFTLTPLQGEASSVTTTLTATSPQCGSGTAFANNQVSLGVSGAIYVADTHSIFAFDQDGNAIANVNVGYPVSGVAFDSTLNQIDLVTSSGPTTGFGQLFQFTPALAQTATGTLNVTVAKNSKTTCNAIGQIAVNASSNVLVACPSSVPGTNAGKIRVVSVTSSGGVATTTDITAGSPKWLVNGNTAMYDASSVLVEPSGNVLVGDAESSGYYFDPTGTYLNATYTSSFTDFAYDSQFSDVLGVQNSTNLYLLANNPQTYVNSFNLPNNTSLIAFNPANDAVYALTSSGLLSSFTGATPNGNTLTPLTTTGFAGLAAPTEMIATP